MKTFLDGHTYMNGIVEEVANSNRISSDKDAVCTKLGELPNLELKLDQSLTISGLLTESACHPSRYIQY